MSFLNFFKNPEMESKKAEPIPGKAEPVGKPEPIINKSPIKLLKIMQSIRDQNRATSKLPPVTEKLDAIFEKVPRYSQLIPVVETTLPPKRKPVQLLKIMKEMATYYQDPKFIQKNAANLQYNNTQQSYLHGGSNLSSPYRNNGSSSVVMQRMNVHESDPWREEMSIENATDYDKNSSKSDVYAAPSKKEEKRIIKEHTLPENKILKETPVYVISASWWNQWKSWVDYDDTGISRPQPGKIDNSDLLEPDKEHLRKAIKEKEDYILLSEEQWSALHAWYGSGPIVQRTIIAQSGVVPAMVSLYPIVLYPANMSNGFHYDSQFKVKHLKNYLCSKSSQPPHKSKLWYKNSEAGYPQHYALDEEKTLEEAGIENGFFCGS